MSTTTAQRRTITLPPPVPTDSPASEPASGKPAAEMTTSQAAALAFARNARPTDIIAGLLVILPRIDLSTRTPREVAGEQVSTHGITEPLYPLWAAWSGVAGRNERVDSRASLDRFRKAISAR